MPLIKEIFLKDIVAFYSTRNVNFHFNKSTPYLTPRQKTYLKKEIRIGVERVFNIRQIHGSRIVLATKRGFGNPKRILKADGILTKDRGIPIAVRTADCANIFLYDPKIKSIGILHAGWRSTKKRIAEKAIRLMQKKWGSQPQNIRVFLGPCIRMCCCEVRESFKKYFLKEVKKISGRFYFDLAAANINQLKKTGVLTRHIRDCKICTYCNKHYYSFRREKTKAGRIISIMMIRPQG